MANGCKKCMKIKAQVEKHPESIRLQKDLMEHYKRSHKLYGKWYGK